MIVVWPLIVSKTVNQNVLPGICKALEKYVHVEEQDRIIEMANKNIAELNKKKGIYQYLKKIGGKLKLTECSELEYLEYLTEAGKKTDPYKGPQPTTVTSSNTKVTRDVGTSQPDKIEDMTTKTVKDPYEDAYQAQKGREAGTTPDDPIDLKKDAEQKALGAAAARPLYAEAPNIGRVSSEAISTEPTWNTVTDQQGNVSAIGVKVVPFVIENEQSLIKLMTLDRYRKDVQVNVHKQSRKILRVIQKIANVGWRKTIGKLLSWTGFVSRDLVSGTVTQNWRKDIILQNTSFKDNMFICLNKLDLDDDFTKNAKGVSKLFTLGWTSFVIADDVNNVASFCLKNYKGMCSMVNYGFLYSDARSQSQIYQDIADVRRNAGPMFRMKRRKKSMITDNLAQYKLDTFSTDILLSENHTLSESAVPDMVKKLKDSPQEMINTIKAMRSHVKRKDWNGLQKVSKKLNPGNKKMDIDPILNKTLKSNPIFKKNYDLTYRIFKNSLEGVSDNALKIGSGVFASVATINKNKKYDLKGDIKKVVLQTRNYQSQKEDNDDFEKDITIAFAYAIIVTLFIGVAGTLVLIALVNALPFLGTAVAVAGPITILFVCIYHLVKLFGGGKTP